MHLFTKTVTLMCAAMAVCPMVLSAQETAPANTTSDAAYQLKLNVPAGAKSLLGIAIKGNIVTTMDGQTMAYAMNMETYNNTEYLAKDASNVYTAKTTISYGKMVMNNQTVPTPLQNMKIGVTMKINEYGQPLEILSMDHTSVPNLPNQMDLNSMMKQSGMTYFPKSPIKVGESWDTDFALPKAEGPMMKLTNTLEKVENVAGKQIASIRSKGQLDMSKVLEAAAQSNPAAGAMKLSGNGTIDMVTMIDVATGLTVGGNGDINMTMNMGVPAQGTTPAQDVQVDTKMQAIITSMTAEQFNAATKPAAVKSAPAAKPAVKKAVKPAVKKAPVKKTK